jgi:hypothetical protein
MWEKELRLDQGVMVTARVNDDGKFVATFRDEEYVSDTLSGLTAQLRNGVKAARVEIPFVSARGRRGIIRGYHASNRDVLITWEDGRKSKLGQRDRVFPADVVSDEQIAEIRQIDEQMDALKARLIELQSGLIEVEKVLNDELNENVTGEWRYEQRKAEEATV